MEKIQVMIVDDSAVVRQTMSSLLSEDPQIEVAATAADPIIAQHKLEKANPDVIILDIEMPRMDGLTFLKQLMHDRPIPIIICSSKTEKGSQNALKAMEYGAVEIIQKPKVGTKQFLEESKVTITDAVKAAKLSKVKKKTSITPIKSDVSKKLTSDVMLSKPKPDTSIETTEKVVVIGASTGGTEALRILLEMMPLNSPPLVIVQHMPEHFTTAFAERLNGLCSITVKEAKNNDSILRGQALIAPGNKHTLLKRSGARYYVEVKDGPLVSRHRPSVDVLFRSAARYGGKNILGVIMTGMGDDGANGMVEMKAAGAYNIAQDEASSVVFGMPNEAIKRGSVDSVVSLSKIADTILSKAK